MNNFKIEGVWREKLLQRFVHYTTFFSESAVDTGKMPSTDRQWDIANYLFQELKNLGLSEVTLDENGYVFAHLPSNMGDLPAVGFIAHYDTSPDFSGENVKAQIWENYQGNTLVLNEKTGFKLDPKQFPEMLQYIGQTLITTDGNSLLGADDKAGLAEIVTAVEYLLQHPEIPHGKICIGFTPDEEIGLGASKFDIQKFGADWAYTMDGGEIGELEYENFNAAGAQIEITGLSVHPGYAKGKMLNAIQIASELACLLPEDETPSTTDGYEGFFHLMSMEGHVSQATLKYIIRDHDQEKFEARQSLLISKVAAINKKYQREVAQVEISEQYLNMKKHIEDKMHIIDLAAQAMENASVSAKIKAIRGGTDGAQLSYMGLPCPNIFAGGHNFHGPYEYVPLESMQKATEVILHICQLLPTQGR